MPAPRMSAETLYQMLVDTRGDIARLELRLNTHSKTASETALSLERISNKLDRALTLETAVVEMRSEFDRAKGMGILGGILLGALEGLVGIISFFRH